MEKQEKKGLKISPAFLKLLMEYNWPGNVRELENLIQVSCALTDKEIIEVADIPKNYPIIKNMTSLATSTAPKVMGTGIKIDEHNDYNPHLSWYDYEKRIIAKALVMHNHNVKETAPSVGIAVTTLYKKIHEWGLDDKQHALFQSDFNYTQE